MKVVIIKYNAGNIFSVQSALKRLNIDATISDNLEIIRGADKVIFPGVGEAATTMKYLQKSGLDKIIANLQQPVLGICLGMQLMCRHSEEGNVDCLNIFDIDVKHFVSKKHEDKIPHMGWNNIYDVKSPLFNDAQEDKYVYFVHSFYVPINEYGIATCNYVQPFCAAMNYKNFYATQFHPEKSGDIGEQILANFLKL